MVLRAGQEPRGGSGAEGWRWVRQTEGAGWMSGEQASLRTLCVWTLVWMGELSWSLSVEGVELFSLGGVFISGLNE